MSPLNRAIYRHGQDSGTNCGRACAQMIISSLTQGPASSVSPSAAEMAVPTITQGLLQTREQDQVDNILNPSWYTHPDEMLALLKQAPEFSAAIQAGWRLADHATQDALIDDVVAAVLGGVPAVMSIDSWDHWVVVIGARLDTAGRLECIEMLDPMPVTTPPHTYVDSCGVAFDGVTLGQPWTLGADELAAYDLRVGTIPPPAGMNNYAGRYLAVVFTRPRVVIPKVPRKHPGQPRSSPFGRPIVPGFHLPLIRELSATAERWDVAPLRKLLQSAPVASAMLVRDIRGEARPYALLSAFSATLGYGVVAALDGEEPVVQHFRFYTSVEWASAYASQAGQELWWTRGRVQTPATPYLPFRKDTSGQSPIYKRLVDGYELREPMY